MFCNYCRAKNPDDSLYCWECGRKIGSRKVDDLSQGQEDEGLGVGAEQAPPAQAEEVEAPMSDEAQEGNESGSHTELVGLSDESDPEVSTTDKEQVSGDSGLPSGQEGAREPHGDSVESRVETPPSGEGDIVTKGPASQPTPLPDRVNTTGKDPLAKYIALTLSVVSIGIVLAVMLFNITWTAVAGSLGGNVLATNPKLLFALLLGGFGANQAWKSLLKVEPENNPNFAKKHKVYSTIAIVCVGITLAAALGLGIVVGSKAEKSAEARTLMAGLTELAKVREDLRTIAGMYAAAQESETIADYHAKMLEIEKPLDKAEPQFKRSRLLLDSINFNLRSSGKDELDSRLMAIYDIDVKGMDALRREIAAVKELIALPEWEQWPFYEKVIGPIQSEIQALGAEQLVILEQFQQEGQVLPSDILELLKEE